MKEMIMKVEIPICEEDNMPLNAFEIVDAKINEIAKSKNAIPYEHPKDQIIPQKTEHCSKYLYITKHFLVLDNLLDNIKELSINKTN